jgi:hypothetical protein
MTATATKSATMAERREQVRAIYGDAGLRIIDQLSEMTPAHRARTLDAISMIGRGSATRIGNWRDGFIVRIGEVSFSCSATPDGVKISPNPRTPLSVSYAHDTEVLLQGTRHGFPDATVFHKLGNGTRSSLATAIMDALLEMKTQRAMR